MNAKVIVLIGLLLMGVQETMQAQSYGNLWKKVEELEKKDLPLSVIETANSIYVKAEKEKNVPQMMKAFLTMTAYRGAVSPDSLQVDMRKLEEWASSSGTSTQDRAVLYSLLGGVVIKNDFAKGDSFLKLSLKDSLFLMKYDAAKFVPMVKVGETSRLYFDDNLYDLLARRAIQLWNENRWGNVQSEVDAQIKRTYQSLLALYGKTGNRSAWLLTALDAYPEADEELLKVWIAQYGDLEVCAEVYLRLTERMQRNKHLEEALALIREGIARYPDYSRVNALKMKEESMIRPRLSIKTESYYPNESMTMKIGHRNLDKFTLFLYKVNLKADSPLLSKLTPEMMSQYGTLIRQSSYSLPNISECQTVTTSIPIDAPEAGIYYWVAQPEDYKEAMGGALMQLTSLLLVKRGLPVDRQELIVLDRKTGHPVPHASVGIYKRKDGELQQTERYEADEKGVVMLTGRYNETVDCQAYTPTDAAMPIHWTHFARYSHTVTDREEEYVHLFTDRALYRPGQRIYYSGVAYNRLKDSFATKDKGVYIVTLLDANRRELARQEISTDDFGTFQGSFDLPQGAIPGAYYVKTDKALATVRVEEYKRPTFEIEFDSVKAAYKAGDSIRVSGFARSLSGAPVQSAKVRYKITQLENGFGRMRGVEVGNTQGEAFTDARGRFEIPVFFSPVVGKTAHWFYNYEISADVTNVAGETQTGKLDLPIGSTSLRVIVPGWDNETIAKEQGKSLNCIVTNLKAVPVEREVVCRVYPVQEGKEGEWIKKECVWQGKAWSNKPFTPHDLYKLPSGRYQLVASVTDEDGKENEQEIVFTLFSLEDNRLPYETEVWCYQASDEFDADGTATVYFGSSEEDVCLFYDVYSNKAKVESRRLFFSDSLLAFRFNYQEDYEQGLRLSFMFAKNGKVYSRSVEIKKPKPEKKLQMRWTSFRDRLHPGCRETWTLRISHADGKTVDAQLMATLYDASLDRLFPHKWGLNLDFPRFVPSYHWNSNRMQEFYLGVPFPVNSLTIQALSYSTLDIPLTISRGVLRMYKANSMAMGSRGALEVKYVPPMSDAAYMEEAVSIELEEETVPDKKDDAQVRTDFAETAFFYPQLRTDEKGEVNIEFTLPESLTQWKFMGLAHTKDMDYGLLDATATVSKDFMLHPNLPRFVRAGDEVTFAASLVNLTAKKVKGTVRMELFHPETDKVIHVQKKTFKVGAEETTSVSFSFTVTEEHGLLACRMIADGGGFSDGEQRYMPVLTNKQWMTESVSLDVDTAGTYKFSLEPLFNHHSKTVTNPRMVVEFTGNPAWYAVQALPVLSEPETENVYSWATAYYANMLAAHIVQNHPQIRQVVESWKAKDDGTLQSALLKNEELKNLLIEETPWLQEALDETGQKQRLSILFDENTLNYRCGSIVAKLKELQQENGAWSWFRGMSGNRYMTTQVTELLARLQGMTGKVLEDNEMAVVYRKAFGYLKNQVQEEYENMRKAETEGRTSVSLSEQALRYLYICTLDASLEPDKLVNDFLVSKLETMTGMLTIYGKSLVALVLEEYGNPKADEFLQSVMEYSVMTPSMGRYFDTPKAEYSWFSYRIPTQVMAMEAVRNIAKEEKTQEEMKRWLLSQKQTQCWETPVATVDAIYALLSTGKDWLGNETSARLTVGEEQMEVSDEEALGYIKRPVEGDVMAVKEITVRKDADGMAWGAVYAQFLEGMEQVTEQSNSLSVSRSLYKDGKPVAPDALAVGDRITVRLTLTSDRDVDFVQLKDERASCLEPADVLSGYRWGNGSGYYQVTKDASTSFFFEKLRKGTLMLEYDVFVTLPGEYQQGVAVVQSVYAPEYAGHSDAMKLNVK